jgi:hypothetical protein
LREKRRRGVFENGVLRGIFGSMRDEVTGEWRKLHNGVKDLYCSSNIVGVIKSSRMRWAGFVVNIGYKTSQLILYRETIAVCSQIHTKHIT